LQLSHLVFLVISKVANKQFAVGRRASSHKATSNQQPATSNQQPAASSHQGKV